jgi:hypothetical protein
MTEGNMFLEKRAHPRVTAQIPVKYRLIEDQKEIESVFNRDNRNKTAHTLDVSLGGLYLSANVAVTAGSILRLDITVPDRLAAIAAFAEVAWSNESGLGLHFLAIRDDDLEVLKAYLTKISNP